MVCEELLDHYRFPRNKKPLAEVNFSAKELNPSCGDRLYIEGYVSGGTIQALRFDGVGCILSQATASMLTEHMLGKPLHAISALSKDDILELIAMPVGPNRLRCALLSLAVLKRGLEVYEQSGVTTSPLQASSAHIKEIHI